MTPPVNISALNKIQLGNLDGLDPKDKSNLFKGTGLIYDEKTNNVTPEKPGQGETNLEMERAYIESLRSADTNHNNDLDLSEVKKLITDSLPPETAATIDPKQFLNNVKALMDGRYNQLGKNFDSFRGQLAFGPTLDALKYYNDGLLSEGYRHANAVLPLNGLPTKSVVNIALSPWSAVRALFGTEKTKNAGHDPAQQSLVADKWAMETAKKNHEARGAAITKLQGVIQEGMNKNEDWALKNDLETALGKLDADSQKLLREELAAPRLHQIMTTEDPKKRYDEMKKFADKERPGFAGIGSGNTSAGWFNTNDLWNISGHRHNTVFARTMYLFLASKATSTDKDFDTAMHAEAKASLFDSTGDNGGFNNIASMGLTGVGCGIGWVFTAGQKVNMSTCVTDYRDWSDEEIIDGPGRGLDGAIMVFGANGMWNRAGQFRKLRGLMSENSLRAIAEGKAAEENLTLFDSLRAYGQGYRKALPVWWEGVKTFRPVTVPKSGAYNPFGKFLNFGGDEKLYAEAIKGAESLQVGKPTQGWFGRKISGLFKGLPELSAEQKANLAKAGNAAKKGFDWTKAFCVVGIASMADGKLNPAYDPFPVDRSADFERYPDPTKAPVIGGKK